MKPLSQLMSLNKKIRVIGFDDAPFSKERGSSVKISGVVCSDTCFEGMVWGEAKKDGNDATDTIIQLLKSSKFFDQINVVLTDGLAVGGFNMIDLPTLNLALQKPCIAVMRKQPDMDAIDKALKNFSDYEQRKQMVIRAGKVFSHNAFYYQVCGCSPEEAAMVLDRVTNNGNVPEALRLAHMIGAAVMTGQSSNRA